MDKRTIISISRQYGSGGREVAQLLTKKTGFHLYDRQIIDSAAKELGISNWTEEQLKALETSEPAPSGSSPSILLGLLKARQTRACSSLNRKSSANWQNRFLHHPRPLRRLRPARLFQTLFLLYLRRRRFPYRTRPDRI